MLRGRRAELPPVAPSPQVCGGGPARAGERPPGFRGLPGAARRLRPGAGMTSTRLATCLFLPALWIVAACEETPTNARRSAIDFQRETFVYRTPPERVYREVQALLAESGHRLPDADDFVGRTVSTDPVQKRTGSIWQHQVRVIPVRGKGHLVHVVTVLMDDDGEVFHRGRSNDLEWELIQRVEPDRALEIAARAEERAAAVQRRQERRSQVRD
jgi:hypothetical protein